MLSYRVADGTRVAKGGVIAYVFSTENDASAQREKERLEKEIESLEALAQPADYFVANPSLLSGQIYSAIEDVAQGVNQNDFSNLASWKETLLSALTRRRLITGEESPEDLAQRISQLQSQKDALDSQGGASIGTIEAVSYTHLGNPPAAQRRVPCSVSEDHGKRAYAPLQRCEKRV